MRILLGPALVLLLACGDLPASAEEPSKEIRLGILGLDAHGLPFTQIVNDPKKTGDLLGVRVVAAWPGGSPDVPTSQEILGRSVEPVRKLGVEILDSVDAVLRKSDAVLILSIDGRTHLELARATIAARKPFFIDKPVAASLADTIRIFEMARQAGVPCFASSSLRYSQGFYGMRDNKAVGKVLGCDAYGPNSPLEPSHPDLFYYGIHGSELLFTIMGPGCVSVSRTRADDADFVVGVWNDGRVGTLRGIRQGAGGFGATVFGDQGRSAGRQVRGLRAAAGRDRAILQDRQAARPSRADRGDLHLHGGGRREQAPGRPARDPGKRSGQSPAAARSK